MKQTLAQSNADKELYLQVSAEKDPNKRELMLQNHSRNDEALSMLSVGQQITVLNALRGVLRIPDTELNTLAFADPISVGTEFTTHSGNPAPTGDITIDYSITSKSAMQGTVYFGPDEKKRLYALKELPSADSLEVEVKGLLGMQAKGYNKHLLQFHKKISMMVKDIYAAGVKELVVTDYIDGPDLFDFPAMLRGALLRKEITRERYDDIVTSIALGMLRGAEHAAKNGFVHMDIKQDNVKLDIKNGLAVIIDAGIAEPRTSPPHVDWPNNSKEQRAPSSRL